MALLLPCMLSAATNPYIVPAEFENKYGDLRPVWKFADGSEVKSAQDWQRRRKEIRKAWLEIIGRPPALLRAPKMTVLSTEEREGFIQKKVRVETSDNFFQEGYLLIPKGARKAPAVVIPFYEPETSIGLGKPERLLDFGYQLTKRGFVTLSIGSPGGDARKPDINGAKCQPLMFLGYIAANCHTALSQLPEVDSSRIGVLGHSYGGKWAMFAACFYDQFAAGVWSDPGIIFDETRPNINYWEPWYLGEEPGFTRKRGVITLESPRTGAYKKLREKGHDLHEVQALMAPRPFLVSGGSEDPPERWVPLNHVRKVNSILGKTNRVAMTNRPNHAPTQESNLAIYEFLEKWLK